MIHCSNQGSISLENPLDQLGGSEFYRQLGNIKQSEKEDLYLYKVVSHFMDGNKGKLEMDGELIQFCHDWSHLELRSSK